MRHDLLPYPSHGVFPPRLGRAVLRDALVHHVPIRETCSEGPAEQSAGRRNHDVGAAL